MSMIRGHAAPLVRIFNADDSLVIEGVTRFSYVFSEKADDASHITVETNDVTLVDHKDLQEGKQLKVIWGYNGDKFFQKRIVYIWDLQTSFHPEGIRIEIVCYCKAAYMKLNSTKDVFDSENLDDMGAEMAEAYGLNYKTENLKEGEEVPSDYSSIHTGGVTNSQVDFTRGGQVTVARHTTANPYIHVWKTYPEGIPQANRSDKKVLEDMAAMEPVDNLFLDTRDDDLIIKRRDFMQVPYKAYTYRAEPGHLLSFSPATKNTDQKKFGVANTVGGWLEEDKEYMQGEINRSHSGAGVLGDIVELSLQEQLVRKTIKIRGQEDLDSPNMVDGLLQIEENGQDENGNPIKRLVGAEKLDTTKAVILMWHKQGSQPSKAVFKGKAMFNSTAIDNTGRISRPAFAVFEPKEYLPLIEKKATDIAGAGVNRQSAKELDLNENQCEIVGDPTLIVGKVITIMGVGKRYSGNYYIFHVNHEIVQETGYKCYLKLYRTGQGKIGDEPSFKIDAKELGYQKNLEIANPQDGTQQLINIPTRKDSDFIK